MTLVKEENWLFCPVCTSKTRIRLRADTQLRNFPMFCPKCKREIIIDVKQNRITVIEEPDAKTQSR